MTTLRTILVLAVVLALASVRAAGGADTAAPAVTDLDVLRDAIRANRKAMVAASLALDGEAAARFWPVYDRYEEDIRAVNDRVAGVVTDYMTKYDALSDDEALRLLDAFLAAEADRVAVRRTYLPEVREALGGRDAARFYQIENKMDAVIRYELAATIPVVRR